MMNTKTNALNLGAVEIGFSSVSLDTEVGMPITTQFIDIKIGTRTMQAEVSSLDLLQLSAIMHQHLDQVDDKRREMIHLRSNRFAEAKFKKDQQVLPL